ncbi:hypothetical protein SDJN02_27195, partial [Cucurbita argyrosperma subsp. argyrosperma]
MDTHTFDDIPWSLSRTGESLIWYDAIRIATSCRKMVGRFYSGTNVMIPSLIVPAMWWETISWEAPLPMCSYMLTLSRLVIATDYRFSSKVLKRSSCDSFCREIFTYNACLQELSLLPQAYRSFRLQPSLGLTLHGSIGHGSCCRIGWPWLVSTRIFPVLGECVEIGLPMLYLSLDHHSKVALHSLFVDLCPNVWIFCDLNRERGDGTSPIKTQLSAELIEQILLPLPMSTVHTRRRCLAIATPPPAYVLSRGIGWQDYWDFFGLTELESKGCSNFCWFHDIFLYLGYVKFWSCLLHPYQSPSLLHSTVYSSALLLHSHLNKNCLCFSASVIIISPVHNMNSNEKTSYHRTFTVSRIIHPQFFNEYWNQPAVDLVHSNAGWVLLLDQAKKKPCLFITRSNVGFDLDLRSMRL